MIFADGLIIKTSDSGGVVLPATTTKEMKQFFALPFELRFSTAGLEPATEDHVVYVVPSAFVVPCV